MQRAWQVVVAVFVCGVGATALVAAEKDWRQEWRTVKISPEPKEMRDIPCPASPETLRITSIASQPQTDPGYKAVEQIRVLILDDVANTGKETIVVPERTALFRGKEILQVRQSGNFSPDLRYQFQYLTGPNSKKEWETISKSGSDETKITHPQSTVTPGNGLAWHLVLWKVSETETRAIGDGKKAQSGTRAQTRYGISSFAYGYHARTERIDPCTGKRIPLADANLR